MTGPQPPYGDQGGQWHGGGDWQAPSDHTQYGGPPPPGYEQPQSYDQPGYEQYQQPQAYDQYGQPGYPDPYSAPPAAPYSPPAGYADPMAGMPPPPPPKQSNPLPWIIGIGAGGLVLVLLICIGGWFLIRAGGDGGGSTGGGSDGGGGKYTGANINNACDLVDPKALEKWASNEEKAPEHSESKGEYYSSFTCNVRYKSEGDDYASASLSLYASISDSAKDSFESAKKSAKGQTGTGRESGDVSGLGEAAYFGSYESHSDYSSSVMYQLGVLDGNLTFTIHLSAFGGKGAVDKDDVADAAEEQARKVLEGFAG